MRTTVTLEPAVERMLRRAMKAKDLSFKAALNEALTMGLATLLGRDKAAPIATPTHALHARDNVNLTKALLLADESDATERMHKRELRK